MRPPQLERPLSQEFPRLIAGRHGGVSRELEETRALARRFGDEHLRPRALEIDRLAGADPAYFDWEIVRAGAAQGLLRTAVPPQAGGAGASDVHTAILTEELSAACPGLALIFGAHALGVAPLLLGGATHWDGLFADLVAAEQRGAPELMGLAATEPEAGSDFEHPELMRRGRVSSHARPVAGGFRLSGTKRFISNGSVARWLSVFMPTDPRAPVETLTAFLVDTRSEGFAVSRVEHKMGQRACPAAELSFEEVFVPREMVIGREHDGISQQLIVLSSSRPVIAAVGTGIARGAYERLATWLHEDPAGRRVREHQHVQLQIAAIEEDVHLARQAYMDAATEIDQRAVGDARNHPIVRALGLVPRALRRRDRVRAALSSPRAQETTVAILHRTTSDAAITRAMSLSSLAKAHCADVAVRVTGTALELVGLGAGPVRAELEKLWRDAKLCQIYEGTNQINRQQVYDGLFAGEVLPFLPRLGARQ